MEITKRFAHLPAENLNACVDICLALYGKDATLKALNKLYHDNGITLDQCLEIVYHINHTEDPV